MKELPFTVKDVEEFFCYASKNLNEAPAAATIDKDLSKLLRDSVLGKSTRILAGMLSHDPTGVALASMTVGFIYGAAMQHRLEQSRKLE